MNALLWILSAGALVAALLLTPWSRFRDPGFQHVYFGFAVGVFLLWIMRTGIVPVAFQGMPMMEPELIASEIVALWVHGENGDVKVKMKPDVPARRIDEPELPPWW